MSTIVLVLLSIGFLACVAICLKIIADYPFDEERKTGVKLGFEELLDLYRVNPEKWTLNNFYIIYTIPTGSWTVRRVYCWLPFFEYLKYRRWLKKRDRAEEKRSMQQAFTQNYADLIKDVQRDIDAARTERAKEIEKKIESIWGSTNPEGPKNAQSLPGCSKGRSIYEI